MYFQNKLFCSFYYYDLKNILIISLLPIQTAIGDILKDPFLDFTRKNVRTFSPTSHPVHVHVISFRTSHCFLSRGSMFPFKMKLGRMYLYSDSNMHFRESSFLFLSLFLWILINQLGPIRTQSGGVYIYIGILWLAESFDIERLVYEKTDGFAAN